MSPAPSAASPGRNDACPCGSGRKFKHCCLRRFEEEDALRMRLRTAEGVLIPGMFAYAAEQFGAEFFSEAWAEFFVWDDVPDTFEDSREYGTTFDPFFVFSFVPDPAERELPAHWPTEPLALHFLHHEIESCPAHHREFIEQACRSHPSFFVVEATVPGRSVDLKDILTGRSFHVLEQSASRTFRPGDLAFARVVTAGGGSILIGATSWVIPPQWHVPVIEFRDRVARGRKLTLESLEEWQVEIREFYHRTVHAMLHPAPPRLQNTDGDPLELTTLTYTLAIPAGEALEKLRPLATLGDTVHVHDEIHDDSGALVAAGLTWIKAGNRVHKEWDNTSLGALRLEAGRLSVEVNSTKRRARITKEIARRLGSSATLVDTVVHDVVKELQGRRRAGGTAQRPNAAPPEPPRDPELERLEAEMARKHWDAWLDMKVPALGNKTPRQAARTPAGRERLAALFTEFERTQEHGPPAQRPDIGRLRQALGLDIASARLPLDGSSQGRA